MEHVLTADEARRVLLATVGPVRARPPVDPTALVDALRHVQLDPIDRIGTNADLVAMARIDGLGRGDVHTARGFEHFAKERCLLPERAFPYYRKAAVETPWWRHSERMKKLDPGLVDAVEAEVRARGPLTSAQLSDHGRVEPMDWSGWKGTGKAGTLALEVLWTRCRVVVVGRIAGQRLYDVPDRALPDVAHAEPTEPFGTWGIRERVDASGMLSTATGPWWSMLKDARTDGSVEALVASGELVRVRVEGSRREWLVRPESLDAVPHDDDRMRILGPLDPLLWNRNLVQQAFGFEYVWEVYKPAAQRRWGYYVMPLLHRGQLVGRLEAHVEDARLVVDRVWREAPGFEEDALEACLTRHAEALGVSR
ncbi:MAG: crosslink repair DNA glycosylase YcaQ family protein [Myxococcota bacterium]